MLLVEDALPLSYRIAGCLVTLYGQAAYQIVTLRTDQVKITGDTVELQLAQDWLEVPEPIATLVRHHIATRPNMNTAANTNSQWLFPGAMPNEPINRQHMLSVLREAGIPVHAARNTTWQQLVREALPAVLAESLGVQSATAMKHALRAGADWTRYAAIRSGTET